MTAGSTEMRVKDTQVRVRLMASVEPGRAAGGHGFARVGSAGPGYASCLCP